MKDVSYRDDDNKNERHDFQVLESQSCFQFTTESLIRAMAPIEKVIDNFIWRHNRLHSSGQMVSSSPTSWTSLSSQKDFATTINVILNEFSPSRRYMKKLVLRFVSKLEHEGEAIVEDETLSELLFSQLNSSSNSGATLHFDENVPSPMDNCYVSYKISNENKVPKNENKKYIYGPESLLHIQIYPFHNDVGIRKVWEAGACLAEFLITYPHFVKDKHVLEFGSGVGLTGLVAATLEAKSVHLTDYTDSTLNNLRKNIDINQSIKKKHCKVTSGFLEWGSYGANSSIDIDKNTNDVNDYKDDSAGGTFHNVLLAADVAYNSDEIPNLVSAVKTFFMNNYNHHISTACPSARDKTDVNMNLEFRDVFAVFATTYRNKKTFELFLLEMDKHNDIQRKNIPKDVIDNLVHIFPCYFDQPRSDVRISVLKYAPSSF